MLTQTEMNKIDRENRAEARRASNNDWTIAIAVVVLALAIIGFAYYAETAGLTSSNAPNNVQPAAGESAAPASSSAYDMQNQNTAAPSNTNATGTTGTGTDNTGTSNTAPSSNQAP